MFERLNGHELFKSSHVNNKQIFIWFFTILNRLQELILSIKRYLNRTISTEQTIVFQFQKIRSNSKIYSNRFVYVIETHSHKAVRDSIRNLNFNNTKHVRVFIRHISAYFHGVYAHDLRVSRETQSNVIVERTQKKKLTCRSRFQPIKCDM